MKKILLIIIAILILLPINTNALTNTYKDITASITKETVEEDKINLYLFYSETCPHCHDEIEYLKTLSKDYKDILNIYKYEVTKNEQNSKVMNETKELFNITQPYVPFTVIGEEYIIGFSEATKDNIENIIESYLSDEEKEKTYSIPILGEVTASGASLSLIAVILGFIDGFNPCAMWILLLLINMTITLKDRKKIFIIGMTFILTGGIIYFLSMLGIGIILDLVMISYIRNIIAIVAIFLGLYNLYTYIKTRKETGCHVVDKNKRKSIIKRINEIMSKKSTILAIIGTIILAISVNLVELACSLGFPTIFLELLSINEITGFSKIIYLIIYILFYLLDDIVVFFIAVITLKSKGISTKYNKFVNLIGGLLMILMGLLLIFKPDWIMFNF